MLFKRLPSEDSQEPRLLPNLIDEIALHDPSRIFAIIPGFQDPNDFIHITFRDLAKAIDRTAWWMKETFDHGGSSKVLVYVGSCDILYHIVIVAAAKLEFETFLPSPENPDEMFPQLYLASKWSQLVVSERFAEEHNIRANNGGFGRFVTLSPSLEYILRARNISRPAQFTLTSQFEEVANSPFVAFQLKDGQFVKANHSWTCSFDPCYPNAGLEGKNTVYEDFIGRRVVNAIPPYHIVGFIIGLLYPVYYGTHTVWFHADAPVTCTQIETMLSRIPADTTFMEPSMLQGAACYSCFQQKLGQQAAVLPGGSVPSTLRSQLFSSIWLAHMVHTILLKDEILTSNDWQFFQFPFTHLQPHQATFSELWRCDINGCPRKIETVNDDSANYPATESDVAFYMEVEKVSQSFNHDSTLTGIVLPRHDKVKRMVIITKEELAPRAFIILRGQFAASDSTNAEKIQHYLQILEKLRPTLALVTKNYNLPVPIPDENIIFTSEDECSLDADDREIVQQFADHINMMERMPLIADDMMNRSSALENEEYLISYIQMAIETITKLGKRCQVDFDIFGAGGLGWKQLVKLVAFLKAVLADEDASLITPKLIFESRTPTNLARSVKRISEEWFAAQRVFKTGASLFDVLENYFDRLSEMKHDPNRNKGSPPAEEGGLVVMLTGSTRSLGSYMLDALLSRPNNHFRKVYCINTSRGRSAALRYRTAANNLPAHQNGGDRLFFQQADLSLRRFGLSSTLYKELQDSVQVVIHTSWKEDLNAGLAAFKTSLDGLLNLIRFSTESRHRPIICFASSTRSVGCYRTLPGNFAPECQIADAEAPTKDGYGQSKWIGEQMLSAASENCDVRSVIWRIGELAGPVNQQGEWPKEGWRGSLITSSKYLRAVPTFGWIHLFYLIPIDVLASILVEICENVYPELVSNSNDYMKAKYYNVRNPEDMAWETHIVPAVMRVLKSNGIEDMQNMRWGEWLELLEASQGNDGENPAFDLLNFYKNVEIGGGVGCLALHKECAFEKSAILRGLDGTNQVRWLGIWLQQLGIIPTAPGAIIQGTAGVEF
ncbi:NAD(P)-binding Rossmann-fold containing protein [Glarea lozoyensis ATCC 20868]|uniref:NAD(P)-binding Rossmann-fold containing protein n=1 Tax=Glarea lozoyensis (strain ATCC 20868 / MF5171) TaxID=1116229 RepID=S3EE45_GLAL2|nr:NAD(P)-binding Rossmann-fold containing protein [Glarea lozoyensis ATCC 20868]EPE36543.1 NAD(P)-binding Rossmann-fold containing protein [Glarea lozoyensis ATCC 20868]